MKKIAFLFFALLLPVVAGAETVEIDGIYYNLIPKGKVAEVTSNPNKYSGNVVIPASVTYSEVEYSVDFIGQKAFYNCSDLTSITIPSSVMSIGGSAFERCSKLTSVNITDLAAWCNISFPSSYSNPLHYAHHLYVDGQEITDLVIPHGVTSIGSNAFIGCSNVSSVTIPGSVTNIGSFAFCGCGSLYSVTIPNSVTSIGQSAFSSCTNLNSITISEGVTSIEQNTFQNCISLSSVTLPQSVTSIGYRAFNGCSNMHSVTIFGSVASIGQQAFLDCNGLNAVHISDLASWCSVSFSYDESNPLYYAHHLYFDGQELTNLVIPFGVKSIGSRAFSGCSSLTSVTIPNSVTKIGGASFANCSSLTSITIPNSVTSIDGSAFYGCSAMTSITIGANVKTIDYCSFASCPKVSDVYCYAEILPQTHTGAFKDSYIEYATLHVPTASIAGYKATAPWSNFKVITSLDGTLPDPQKCSTPTISYIDGKLVFDCETEGAEYVYEIKHDNVKKGKSKEVTLTPPTTTITVYATATGYDDSDVATATIGWRNGAPVLDGFVSIKLDGEETNGDVNGDGTVDVADIATIISIMAGK